MATGRGFAPIARVRSIQQPIPVVALVRFVAELPDEPLHVGHRHAEGCARLADNVFLDHDAAEVVRAELERDLADFLSLGDPRTLDVGEIVEVDAPQRLRAQIFVRADRRCLELRVLGLERPADECGEAL